MIQYRKGKLIANADALSRLPVTNPTNVLDFLYSFNMVESVPLSSKDIDQVSKKD